MITVCYKQVLRHILSHNVCTALQQSKITILTVGGLV